MLSSSTSHNLMTATQMAPVCGSVLNVFPSFLADSYKRPSSTTRPKAVELGSGIGVTALTLASIGWHVLATDIPNVVSTVLSKNIVRNAASLPVDSGSIEIRELDWTVPPENWTWENDTVIASATSSEGRQASDLEPSSLRLDPSIQTIGPPFDLIVTSDTIYSPELVQPLLRTLCALCCASRRASACPPIYLCIERRDPDLINRTLAEARSVWGFTVIRIPHRKVAKAMEKGGVKWDQADWEGVEIWKLTLPNLKSSATGQNRLPL